MRAHNKPWKHIYGIDRKYTARVDRLAARRPASSAAHSASDDPPSFEGNADWAAERAGRLVPVRRPAHT